MSETSYAGESRRLVRASLTIRVKLVKLYFFIYLLVLTPYKLAVDIDKDAIIDDAEWRERSLKSTVGFFDVNFALYLFGCSLKLVWYYGRPQTKAIYSSTCAPYFQETVMNRNDGL